MESADYAGCQNKLDCTTLSAFKAIFEGPSIQTDATYCQIRFKSWVYNVDLDLNLFRLKSMQWWLEKKLIFRLLQLLLNLEQIALSNIQCILDYL